jgi:hypothetical protein
MVFLLFCLREVGCSKVAATACCIYPKDDVV